MGYFDDTYYMASKLQQLTAEHATDANGEPYNAYTLSKAIASAGLTPEEHFKAYGQGEKLNPNAYFNETEYLEAKLAQLHSVGETGANGRPYTLETLKAVIAGSGLSAAEHYELYGSKETTADGHLLNPSNAFDANAYVAAKLAQLQSEGSPEAAQWAGKTVAELVAVLQAAGISPVTHYIDYGAAEATTAKIALVQTVPSEQRVANDPAREAKSEVVPTNYNPATPAPGDAKAAPVTKPADVDQKVDPSVSPTPLLPEKSAPVPGDDAYMTPPANIKDTVDNPVIPPSSADTGIASGNWMVVNPGKGTGIIVGQDGIIKGEVKVEIAAGDNGSTVVIPPAEDKAVDKLPPATTLPPSITPDKDHPGNVVPDGGDTGGGTVAPVSSFGVTEAGTALTFTGDFKGEVVFAEEGGKAKFTSPAKTVLTTIDWAEVTAVTIGNDRSLKAAYADLDADTLAVITGKVTVSGAALSIDSANILDAKVNGVIKATIAEASTVACLKDLTADEGANEYTINIQEVSVAGADLTAIRAKTTVNVALAETVATITGTAAEVKALYAAMGSFTGLGNEAVTVANAAPTNAADLNAINDATSGVVTASTVTALTGNATDLATVFVAKGLNTISLGANVAVSLTGDAYTADQLALINEGTTGTITLANTAVALTGTAGTLGKALLLGVASYTGDVSVSDATTLAALKALDDKSGTVAYMAVADSATALNTNTGGYVKEAINVNVIDAAGAVVSAAVLTSIDGKTTGTVTVDNALSIAGTSAEWAAFAAEDTLTLTAAGTTKVVVTGELSVSQLDGIATKVGGDTGTGTITISGHTGYDFSTAGSTRALTITGEAGDNTIKGGKGADTIAGGAGNDSLYGGAGNDILNGGVGNDSLTGGAGTNTFLFVAADFTDAVPSASILDKIEDWSAGTANKIDFGTDLALGVADTVAASGTAKVVAGIATFSTEDDTFAERLTAVGAALSTAGAVAIFVEGGNTFLFISNAAVGVQAGDGLIQLTGVTGITTIAITGGDITGFTV